MTLFGAVTYEIERGLLVVEDPESVYPHDGWDPSVDFVSAGPDSIFLSVQPAVDGAVELTISDGETEVPEASHLYFDGVLQTDGRYVVVRDADDVMRFSVRRPPGANRVRVLVDEPGLASVVHVVFVPVRSV